MVNESEISARAAGDYLQFICHAASVDAGWWPELPEVWNSTRFGKALVNEKIALIHSEVSEALEGFRKAKMDEHLPHRMSIEVELAEAIIRIADLAGALNLNLGDAIAEKMAYNAVRPDHKLEARAAEGGKAF